MMKIEMNPNEMVIKAGDSNQVLNGNSIKGKLILTTQRLFFKASEMGYFSNFMAFQYVFFSSNPAQQGWMAS